MPSVTLNRNTNEVTLVTGARGPAGATGATGPAGANGTNGTNGTNGIGVPAGGTTGQVLSKINSTDYNTQWVTPSGGSLSLYATIAALKAVASPTDGTPAFLSVGSRGVQFFVFRSGDYSAEVTADTREGWFIESDDVASTSGAWVADFNEWNVRHAGAVADGVTNDQPAIQHAIDMALAFPHYSNVVRIPNVYDGTTESTRWYQCTSRIEFEGDNIVITGDGPFLAGARLRFDAQSHGIYMPNTGSTQHVYVTIKNLHLKGDAPNATSGETAVTVGLYLVETSYSTFTGIYIEDFVDGVHLDADSSASTTAGMIRNEFDIRVEQNAWPNQYNSFPRYGIWSRNTNSSTNKLQTSKFNINIYSQITVKTATHDGDGSTTAFQLNVGSGTFGLSAETGIEVYVKDAAGRWEKKAITTDYTLWDVTGGGATQITAGADAKSGTMPSTNGYAITDVEVRFVAPPTSGTSNIATVRNDPYGEIGFFMQVGSGNHIDGAIGGYRYAVQSGASGINIDENAFHLEYLQLCKVGLKAFQGEPTQFSFVVGEYAEAHVSDFTELGTASNLQLDIMAGTRRYFAKRTTDLTLASTYLDALTWTVPNNRPGTYREIVADLDFEMTETTTTRIAIDFNLKRSIDGGANYTSLKFKRVDIDITGATGNKQFLSVPFHFVDETAISNVYNVTTDILYVIEAKYVAGDTRVVNGSASSAFSSGSVTVLNP